MVIESGLRSTELVRFLSPAGDCDEHERAVGLPLAKPLCKLVPVHSGQTDVEERDGGLECFRRAQPRQPIVLDAHIIAEVAQDHRETRAGAR